MYYNILLIQSKSKYCAASPGICLHLHWSPLSDLCSSVLLLVSDRCFLSSDTFQLVSVKLTKGAGQDLESKELSVVLDGVGASVKHIAFGREVCSPLGSFLLWGVGCLEFFFHLKWTLCCLCLYTKHSGTETKLKVNNQCKNYTFFNITKTEKKLWHL